MAKVRYSLADTSLNRLPSAPFTAKGVILSWSVAALPSSAADDPNEKSSPSSVLC